MNQVENFQAYDEWFKAAFWKGEDTKQHLDAIVLNIKDDLKTGLLVEGSVMHKRLQSLYRRSLQALKAGKHPFGTVRKPKKVQKPKEPETPLEKATDACLKVFPGSKVLD